MCCDVIYLLYIASLLSYKLYELIKVESCTYYTWIHRGYRCYSGSHSSLHGAYIRYCMTHHSFHIPETMKKMGNDKIRKRCVTGWVVSHLDFHADDPGSIPGLNTWLVWIPVYSEVQCTEGVILRQRKRSHTHQRIWLCGPYSGCGLCRHVVPHDIYQVLPRGG